jgi:hypothetical protein
MQRRMIDGSWGATHREFALGIEGLDRFVRGEPLRPVHECAFAVLALETRASRPRSWGNSRRPLFERCSSLASPQTPLALNKQSVVLSVRGGVERETGFEPATFCLGSSGVPTVCPKRGIATKKCPVRVSEQARFAALACERFRSYSLPRKIRVRCRQITKRQENPQLAGQDRDPWSGGI